MSEIKIAVEEIDAAKAQEYLDREVAPTPGRAGSNRKASPALVARWAQMMVAGRWHTTHQGIAFDGEGKLVDGGHRLRAVLLAARTSPDVKVTMPVARGLSPEAVMTLDTGRKRSPGDFLTMKGETNSMHLAALIRLCAGYDSGLLDKEGGNFRKRAQQMPPDAQEEYLERYPELRDSVRVGATMNGLMNVTAAGALHFLSKRDRKDWEVAEFLTQVREGFGPEWGRGNAAYTLRELLLLNFKRTYRHTSSVDQLALGIKGLAKWAAKEECLILTWRNTEDFPRLT